MKNNARTAISAIVVSGCCVVSPFSALATPTTYTFDETSSSVPGFTVTASLVINGDFAALPSISNEGNPGPYNFGDLLNLNFSSADKQYSLANFTAEGGVDGPFPQWRISPFEIMFVDAIDGSDFEMNLPTGQITTGQITLHSDDPATGCTEGGCIASGVWTTVPEPATVALFGSGLAGAMAMRRRKKKVA